MSSYIRSIKVQPYGWLLYVFDDADKWAQFSARKTQTPVKERLADTQNASGLTLISDNSNVAFIGVFDGEPATLAHEMVHVACAILRRAAVKFNAANDEPLAYLVGHLVDECVQKVYKPKVSNP